MTRFVHVNKGKAVVRTSTVSERLKECLHRDCAGIRFHGSFTIRLAFAQKLFLVNTVVYLTRKKRVCCPSRLGCVLRKKKVPNRLHKPFAPCQTGERGCAANKKQTEKQGAKQHQPSNGGDGRVNGNAAPALTASRSSTVS